MTRLTVVTNCPCCIEDIVKRSVTRTSTATCGILDFGLRVLSTIFHGVVMKIACLISDQVVHVDYYKLLD